MRRLGHLVADPAAPGGVAVVVRALLETAAERGRDDVVLTLDTGWRGRAGRLSPGAAEQLDGLDGVVVHGVLDPRTALATARLRRERPQLPVVALPHDAYDDGLFEQSGLRKRAYFAAVERRRLRSARAVVTLAPSHERWLRARGVDVPVVTARCGLSAAERERAALERRRRRPLGEVPAVVFVGRWDVAEKGLDLLLQAAAAQPPASMTLRVVGPELGARARLERLAAGCGVGVDLVGWAPDAWAEIAGADLLVLPSRKEGFGLVALQALACGVPVLLSSRAGLAEHVRPDDGVVVVAPEPAALGEALARALVDLPRLGEAALGFAEQRAPAFTYDVLDDALLAGCAPVGAR